VLEDADDSHAPVKAYETFGIVEGGALVVVRPDGYIGVISQLDDVKKIGEYFSLFLTQ
jgi:phenol 2-monooxygenase (NADPH)